MRCFSSPIRLLPVLLLLSSLWPPSVAQAQQQQQATTADRDLSDLSTPTLLEQGQEPFETLDFDEVSTGVLYDRANVLSEAEKYTGQQGSATISYGSWEQLYVEMEKGQVSPMGQLPKLESLREDAVARVVQDGVVPIVVMDLQYDKIKETAIEDGLIERQGDHLYDISGSSETPYQQRSVFTASVIGETVRDRTVTFALDSRLYAGNLPHGNPDYFEVNLGDGSGFQRASFGDEITASYASDGMKTGRLRAHYSANGSFESAFTFEVQSLSTPGCDEKWGLEPGPDLGPIYIPPEELYRLGYDGLFTGSHGTYKGEPALFNACAFYGAGHTSIEKPLILVEGFDINGTLDIPTLYSQYGELAEGLRSIGFDVIILNFYDAKTYIQRNSEALITLIEDINALKTSREPNVVVGASMGGIVARYALSKMETNGREHETATYVSFDSPHRRANIPLGLQY